MSTGAKTWCFPDGYLPQKSGVGAMESHEALMLLNTNDQPAWIELDFYFEDREPTLGVPIVVDARRVKALRLDHPDQLGGVCIPPLTQYALRIRSDRKIVAQFGRLDTTQSNLAYYVGVGYSED